jgi:ESCRT-II complex subunit VPS36
MCRWRLTFVFSTRKSNDYQAGTVHVSSHRLFYYSDIEQHSRSWVIDLKDVKETEYYAGLLRSSAKVTLHLKPPSPGEEQHRVLEEWICEVCACRNSTSTSGKMVCTLCGVPRDKSASASSTPPPSRGEVGVCPACTFLNHASLRECEICGTSLPSRTTPPPPPPKDTGGPYSIKLSCRNGGDKPLYAILKRSLTARAWEETSIEQLRPEPTRSGICTSFVLSSKYKMRY